MAMNLQTSFLTPPFGFALFYLRGVAPPEIKTGDIYRGVVLRLYSADWPWGARGSTDVGDMVA